MNLPDLRSLLTLQVPDPLGNVILGLGFVIGRTLHLPDRFLLLRRDRDLVPGNLGDLDSTSLENWLFRIAAMPSVRNGVRS